MVNTGTSRLWARCTSNLKSDSLPLLPTVYTGACCRVQRHPSCESPEIIYIEEGGWRARLEPQARPARCYRCDCQSFGHEMRGETGMTCLEGEHRVRAPGPARGRQAVLQAQGGLERHGPAPEAAHAQQAGHAPARPARSSRPGPLPGPELGRPPSSPGAPALAQDATAASTGPQRYRRRESGGGVWGQAPGPESGVQNQVQSPPRPGNRLVPLTGLISREVLALPLLAVGCRL